MRAVPANDALDARPVVVMSSSEPMEGMSREILDRGQQLHAEIARLSTRGRHVIVAASYHMSLLTEREHAQRVAELLGEVIAESATLLTPP